jgi:dihydrofolate reductase
MRKVIIAQFLTLDGVSQAPGGDKEDVEEGFAYGGWQMPYLAAAGEEADEIMARVFDNMGAMLLGRKTYDIFASYWPTAGDDPNLQDESGKSLTALMNSVPIYVASHADSVAEWKGGDVTQLKDIAKEINELKQQEGKDIVVWGSGNFAQTLMREGLVDEFALTIYPLVLGSGKKLFTDSSPKLDLELIYSKITSNGVIAATYRVNYSK